MIDAYNATPENFGVPSDEVINEVIRLVDQQMEIDSRIERPLYGSLAAEARWETPSSKLIETTSPSEEQKENSSLGASD